MTLPFKWMLQLQERLTLVAKITFKLLVLLYLVDFAHFAIEQITQLISAIKNMVTLTSIRSSLVPMFFLRRILMQGSYHLQALMLLQVPTMAYLKSNALNLYPCCNKLTWMLHHLPQLDLLPTISLPLQLYLLFLTIILNGWFIQVLMSTYVAISLVSVHFTK